MATVQARASIDVAAVATGTDAAAGVQAPAGTVQASMGMVQAPAGKTMTLARGDYEMVLRFDVPRAQIVDFTIACPGSQQHGTLGETFAAYRERRLAQLRADRERQRQTTATVTGAVIGAVAPDVHAHGRVDGPSGAATADAHVSGQAVGAAAGNAIADATVTEVVELAAWDVGATQLHTKVHVAIAEEGACTITAFADDPGVRAMFDIVHVRDLKAEERARKAAATARAHEVRGELHAQLVAFGADPLARQRRLEAEARTRAEAAARLAEQRAAEARVRAEHQAKLDAELRLRADAEARVRAERQAKLDLELRARADLELRLREQALHTRGALIAYLTGECNADPSHRDRVRAEREARLRIEMQARLERERVERERREAHLRIEAERRRVERERLLAIEAAATRRLEVALATRASLRAYLVSLGARERPPMPAPLPETPGARPFPDAIWIAGAWRWTGGQWIWEAGGWRDETVFGSAGASGGVVVGGGGDGGGIGGGIGGASFDVPVSIEVGGSSAVRVRDHRTTGSSQPSGGSADGSAAGSANVRDHRGSTSNGPTVRDHRTSASTGSATSSGSTSGSGSSSSSSSSSSSNVRDHRRSDDPDGKKTSGPRVRDHRR